VVQILPVMDIQGWTNDLAGITYIYRININQWYNDMKKLLTLSLLVSLSLTCLSQHKPWQWQLPDGGPPAGELREEYPSVPFRKPVPLKELDYDSLNMQFTGNWPYGQSFSVSSSVTGDTVFFGSGAGLVVADATDPWNPVQIAGIRARSLIDHSYYDASAGLLFLAAYFSGVEIWDVSDFGAPHCIARIPLNSYPRGGIYARDGILYIVTVADGLYIADISDPHKPSIMAHQIISGSLVWTSSFHGDHAYLSQGSSGIKIVNISDPYNPFIESVFSTNATGIVVKDHTGYVVAHDFGLRIFDFSDLTAVSLLGELALDGFPYRLAKSGDHVYIANSTTNPGGGINAVDVGDPENPFLCTTLTPAETFISAGGQVLAASGNSDGFLLVDISDPADPQYASELNTAWSTIDIAVQGNHAYTGSNGFRVFDMSDPAYPVQVGFEETDGAIVRLSDTLAVYIPNSMGSGNRVNIMDIADPENPEHIGYYPPPVMTNDLVLKGHHAYVACWWDGFRVVNFSNPSGPALVSHNFGWVNGSIPGEEFCYVQALDIYGDYLYVLDYGPFPDQDSKGLYIWDISVPDDPQLLHRFEDMLSMGHDLRAWGDYVYISDKEGGMEVVNVPFTCGYLALTDAAWGIDISWPYVYVSQYILGGVHIVNVMDPADPQLLAYYKRSGCFALGVTAWDQYALVADGPAGMQVYDFLLATDIAEPEQKVTGTLSVFPNPARNHFSIACDLPYAGRAKLSIFDIGGKMLREVPLGDAPAGILKRTIETGDLNPGVYMLRLDCRETSLAAKLLVGRNSR